VLRCLLQVADQSCGTACLWLGQLSERGLGLPAADYVEAAAWYGQGAELGHLECAQALAFCYQHGLGEPHLQLLGRAVVFVYLTGDM
jgi:TPR repeat protein